MIFVILIIILSIFLYIQDNDLTVTNIEYNNYKIPENFNKYKILHVSDLHNKKFGNNQVRLINKTKIINPDIIVVTGDIIDKRRTNVKNMEIALCYLKEAVKIAPVYFVAGNHEVSARNLYPEFRKRMIEYGVIDLNDKTYEITKDMQSIKLIGLKNINSTHDLYSENSSKYERKLNSLRDSNYEGFNILLSHRPDLLNVYKNAEIDLVFCGHAHGGQIRLPYLGGLYSPNQGILPNYTSNIYKKDKTSMVVSRGLGNSRFPFRIFNKPEIVVVNLYKK